MSHSGERYKKWLLHTKTQWPQRDNYTDKLLQSWLGDRDLNAFHWDKPESVSDAVLNDKFAINRNYIDYIASSNLIEATGGQVCVFLLDAQGVVLYQSSTSQMAKAQAELGIHQGSVLSKMTVGTTAYSLASESNQVEHIATYESYLKDLHAFHMICAPVSNDQRELFLMVWLDTDDEAIISRTERLVSKVVKQPSLNLKQIQLLTAVLDNCDSMIFVFDCDGQVILKNDKARMHSNTEGVIANGRLLFNFEALFHSSSATSKIIEKQIQDKQYKLNIDSHQLGQELIVYTTLSCEQMVSDEWKHELVGESINKDSYLDKVIKQRQKTGLRLFITGEVGTGIRYIVHYLSKHLAQKKRVHMDCLAGFSTSDVNDIAKTKFIDILHKANNHILNIENIEYLSHELQVVLLKVLSSGMISTIDNQTVPANIDFICSSSDNLWQTTRTNRLLYLMLSISHISLKPIGNDAEKLNELIYKIISKINRRENRALIITDQAKTVLLSYTWPGNYLEVFQIIENACLKCHDDTITEHDIPLRMNAKLKNNGMNDVKEAERNAIISAWQQHRGKLAMVSNELGLSRTTLWRKMKKLNLDKNSLSLDKH
ncbi:helix-turn-helix domain-containing protein [Photobacterium nomapromontoriensis]|uniref:helix-turn-helix domain-containing protein n=1 Tax=Photobacterium nomapromontoriensis TaxID=2910237 RepID=UPI003D1227D1